MLGRVRNESGLTLPEVLVTLSIGMIISLAGFGLVETTMTQAGEVNARIDAVQRGRSAMDTATRQLRSQACLMSNFTSPGTLPRAIEAGTPDAVTFYVDLRDISNKPGGDPPPPAGHASGPERRSLAFEVMDPADPKPQYRLIERRWLPRAHGGANYVYQDPPNVVREVITGVERAEAKQFFQYYAYDFALAVPQPVRRVPQTWANPLSVTDAQSVAKIKITYRAQPTQRRKDDRASTVFGTDVFVRTVDPNADTAELNTPCL